jgi:predicted component of type VI protein secretion system
VVINHESLSKRHCVVVKTDGLLVIRDLLTTNGTKVKGQKIRWAALLPDDRIAFGAYKMRVYLGPDDVPAPSERAAAGKAVAPVAKSADPKAKKTRKAKANPKPATPAGDPGLEILDDDSGEDSGWRRLLAPGQPGQPSQPADDDDDVIIELD